MMHRYTHFATAVLICAVVVLTEGFSLPSMISRTPQSSMCSLWSTTDEAAKGGESFAPMSQDEVEALLDSVPVYTITEPDKEGLVLLKDKQNPDKEIAYFFLSADTANTLFAPLRQQNPDASWDVTQYPLGVVWFELFQAAKEGDSVQYRLVPEGSDLAAAQNLLAEQSKQTGSPTPEIFQSNYNEIPVFVDQFLRVQAEDGEEKFPMYLGYNDMVATLQQASAATGGSYEAALSVVDMESLIEQMMQKNPENDFRKVLLVRPSNTPPTTSTTGSTTPGATSIPTPPEDDGEFQTPTATETWDD